MKVHMEQEILKANEDQAEQNRAGFGSTLVVNLIGSPGCGKTTILERTIPELARDLRLAVIEGDVYTTKDAARIEVSGVPVVQVNTQGGCHISAEITARAASEFDLAELDLLVIENVGNLVCPAEFDLGEDVKIAVLSTPEGDDKPAKYPLLFQECGLVIINKCDLIPYTSFDLEGAKRDIRALNPNVDIIEMDAAHGEGMDAWLGWLRRKVAEKRGR